MWGVPDWQLSIREVALFLDQENQGEEKKTLSPELYVVLWTDKRKMNAWKKHECIHRNSYIHFKRWYGHIKEKWMQITLLFPWQQLNTCMWCKHTMNYQTILKKQLHVTMTTAVYPPTMISSKAINNVHILPESILVFLCHKTRTNFTFSSTQSSSIIRS